MIVKTYNVEMQVLYSRMEADERELVHLVQHMTTERSL